MVKNIKLNRLEIQYLMAWLDIPLHGNKIINRNSFIKEIKDVYSGIEPQRRTWLEEMAKKDESGKPIVVDNRYEIDESKKIEFDSKWKPFITEELEFKFDKKVLSEIKKILDTNLRVGLGIAEGGVYTDIINKL